MNDELEKYVKEHREAFDDFKPNKADMLNLWDKIENELPEPAKPVIPLWRKTVFRVAASVVLFFGFALMYFIVLNSGNTEHQIVNQELYEIDNHYKILVNNQIELIKNSKSLSKADQDDFLLLIEDLDKECENLKNELKEGINNQRIIEAIIANYRKKLELMENLLERIYATKNNLDHDEIIL